MIDKSKSSKASADPLIKICGLQSVAMVESLLDLPIDYIGFVFATSKRQVTASNAREMIESVKSKRQPHNKLPQTVGVFVNPTKEQLREVLAVAPLDVVQLHGQESAEFCRWVKETFCLNVFKVFTIGDQTSALGELAAYAGVIDVLMLDTYDPHVGGGTGKTFAWEKIAQYRKWAEEIGVPLIVAGGLTADNVADLMAEYGPDGVDVSSGVETNGEKDLVKIADFVKRVNRNGRHA